MENEIVKAPEILRIFIKFASGYAIIFGTLIILSQLFYYWVPYNIIVAITSIIKPNTALIFIFAGISLWLRNEHNGKYYNYVVEILSGLIFLISFITFIRIFF